LLTGQSLHYATSANGSNETVALATGGGLLFLPVVLMIVFRQKYPRWWFDWNLQLLRFSNRVSAYLGLLDDRYPSADEEQAVHLDLPYPDARQLNRGLPLVKWLLAIPHYIAVGTSLTLVTPGMPSDLTRLACRYIQAAKVRTAKHPLKSGPS
jgi:hypothetical protein